MFYNNIVFNTDLKAKSIITLLFKKINTKIKDYPFDFSGGKNNDIYYRRHTRR